MARGQRRAVAPACKAETVESIRARTKAPRAGRRGSSGRLTTAERAELTELRQRVKMLARERDMLEEATAFFAAHSAWNSDLWRRRRRLIS